MPSTRLKIKSNFPFLTRSTQRPSLVTGTRTTSVAQSRSALSTASMESSSCTSGALPSADRPSNNKAIFIACSPSSVLWVSRQPAGDERSLAGCCLAGGVEIDSLSRRCVFQTALNELVITDPGRARCLRQTRIVRWIGKNPRQRIYLEHVRATGRVQTNVDSRPVSASENAERIERNALNGRLKLFRDTSRALENFERLLGSIPHELRIEAVDRQRAFGQRLEIHSDYR